MSRARLAHVSRARMSRKVFLVTRMFSRSRSQNAHILRGLCHVLEVSHGRGSAARRKQSTTHERCRPRGTSRRKKELFLNALYEKLNSRAGQKFSRPRTKASSTKARHGPRARAASLPFRSLRRKLRGRVGVPLPFLLELSSPYQSIES